MSDDDDFDLDFGEDLLPHEALGPPTKLVDQDFGGSISESPALSPTTDGTTPGVTPRTHDFNHARNTTKESKSTVTVANKDSTKLGGYEGVLFLNWNGGHMLLDPSKPELKIGKKKQNDLVVDSSKVSKFHCLIENGLTLVDCNSKNGTRVNGQKISRAELRPGDMIEIGALTLHITASDSLKAREIPVIPEESDSKETPSAVDTLKELEKTSLPSQEKEIPSQPVPPRPTTKKSQPPKKSSPKVKDANNSEMIDSFDAFDIDVDLGELDLGIDEPLPKEETPKPAEKKALPHKEKNVPDAVDKADEKKKEEIDLNLSNASLDFGLEETPEPTPRPHPTTADTKEGVTAHAQKHETSDTPQKKESMTQVEETKFSEKKTEPKNEFLDKAEVENTQEISDKDDDMEDLELENILNGETSDLLERLDKHIIEQDTTLKQTQKQAEEIKKGQENLDAEANEKTKAEETPVEKKNEENVEKKSVEEKSVEIESDLEKSEQPTNADVQDREMVASLTQKEKTQKLKSNAKITPKNEVMTKSEAEKTSFTSPKRRRKPPRLKMGRAPMSPMSVARSPNKSPPFLRSPYMGKTNSSTLGSPSYVRGSPLKPRKIRRVSDLEVTNQIRVESLRMKLEQTEKRVRVLNARINKDQVKQEAEREMVTKRLAQLREQNEKTREDTSRRKRQITLAMEELKKLPSTLSASSNFTDNEESSYREQVEEKKSIFAETLATYDRLKSQYEQYVERVSEVVKKAEEKSAQAVQERAATSRSMQLQMMKNRKTQVKITSLLQKRTKTHDLSTKCAELEKEIERLREIVSNAHEANIQHSSTLKEMDKRLEQAEKNRRTIGSMINFDEEISVEKKTLDNIHAEHKKQEIVAERPSDDSAKQVVVCKLERSYKAFEMRLGASQAMLHTIENQAKAGLSESSKRLEMIEHVIAKFQEKLATQITHAG